MSLFDLTKDGITSLIYTLSGWECPEDIALCITRIIAWTVICISLILLYRRFYLIPMRKKKTYIMNHIDSGYQEYLTPKSKRLFKLFGMFPGYSMAYLWHWFTGAIVRFVMQTDR